MLPSGIPTRQDYLRLEASPYHAELYKFSREFAQKCVLDSESTRKYSRKWVEDPFLQWSRRWAYVYVAQHLLRWASNRPTPLKVVDAGSGFTFFPFYVMQSNPGIDLDCLDRDPVAGEALLEAADKLGLWPGFHIEDLENLMLDDQSVDAVYSVSVIEHTASPEKVIEEIHRILKPGGVFICTFDVSFESKSPMSGPRVAKLVARLTSLFDPPADWKPVTFESLPDDDSLVSTQWNSEAVRANLPWRRPILVWMYDLMRGRFRRQLYRPMTFCCGAFTKKPL